MKPKTIHYLFLGLTILTNSFAMAREVLAKQSQNPLGTIISALFENNINF